MGRTPRVDAEWSARIENELKPLTPDGATLNVTRTDDPGIITVLNSALGGATKYFADFGCQSAKPNRFVFSRLVPDRSGSPAMWKPLARPVPIADSASMIKMLHYSKAAIMTCPSPWH